MKINTWKFTYLKNISRFLYTLTENGERSKYIRVLYFSLPSYHDRYRRPSRFISIGCDDTGSSPYIKRYRLLPTSCTMPQTKALDFIIQQSHLDEEYAEVLRELIDIKVIDLTASLLPKNVSGDKTEKSMRPSHMTVCYTPLTTRISCPSVHLHSK